MELNRTLILIDGDSRRRAAISHALSGGAVHVEPFENTGEVSSRWLRSGMVLAHDDGENVAGLVDHMTESGNWLPVIAFAESPAPGRVVESILEGAIDYLAWPFSGDDLEAARARASARAEAMGSAKLREAMARSRIDRLTRREREVLSGVASGLSNRLIGEKLAISPRTVEIHRANMLNKMGAHHTSEAIRIAIEAALIH